MVARYFAAAALAGLVTAATAQRAPLTARYRVDQTLTHNMDASAAGKGKQTISFSTVSFLTLTFTDSTGGRSVRVVVDSMRCDSTAPIPAEVFDSALQTTFQRDYDQVSYERMSPREAAENYITEAKAELRS
jgi:hypothetical protein